MEIRLRLLGPVEALVDGRPADVGHARQRCVLAVLALHANRAVSRDQLVERVWGGRDLPRNPAGAVQTYVSLLRRALSDTGAAVIRRQPGGYALAVEPVDVDVHRFEDLLARARDAGDDALAEDLLDRALRLWRGDAFGGLTTPWLDSARAALEAERWAAELDLNDVRLRSGGHAGLIAPLTEAARRHPLDERLAGQLLLALYRGGRQADALRHYERLRRLLADELGADPGPPLRALHRRILDADPALALRAPVKATAPRATVPRQLPAAPAPFTGRDREVAWLHAAIGERGATAVISGTAGVGKTALALHWAHRVRHRFPDGQLYIDLRGYDPERPVTVDESLVRLLGALGVAEEELPPRVEDRAARWRTETSDRRLLLVLDNAASAGHVRPLLPGTPSCAVLVTSRDHLAGLVAVEGACRLELDLFPLADAVALLRRLIGDRAVADPGATEALAEQCARLPLALRIAAELAALRAGVPVADLVGELSDRQRRLDLLRAGDDAHEAVDGVLSWSYRHLPAAARRVFRLLGLHPDTAFTDRAVAALAGTTADRARELVDLLARAHLVQRTGPNRATTHDLLRAYARRTTEAEDAESDRRAALTRLFDHYLATASAAMDAVHPAERHHRPAVPTTSAPFADVDSARAWLDAERPAVLAVCGHAAAHGWPRHATTLAATLYRYLESGHYTDALAVHGHALRAARQSGDRHAEAVARTNLGAVHRLLGHYDVAGDHLRQALAVFRALGDRRGEARARSNLGVLDDRTGRHESAAEHCEQALALYRALDDRWGEASALTNLGAVEEELGRPEQAATHLRQALERYRELGDRWGEAVAATNLGDLCARLGHSRDAEDHLDRAVTAFHALGHRYGEAVALSNLGALAARTGRLHLAARQQEQALDLYRELGHRYGEASALNGLGELLTRDGDPTGAVERHEAALAITADTGDRDEAARAHAGLARAHDLAGAADRSRHHRRLALALSDGALGRAEGESTGAQWPTV